MIPLLRALWHSLLWDSMAAGRLLRGVLLAVLVGAQPLLLAAQEGRDPTTRQVYLSLALALGGALVGWLRAGEPNPRGDATVKPDLSVPPQEPPR